MQPFTRSYWRYREAYSHHVTLICKIKNISYVSRRGKMGIKRAKKMAQWVWFAPLKEYIIFIIYILIINLYFHAYRIQFQNSEF